MDGGIGLQFAKNLALTINGAGGKEWSQSTMERKSYVMTSPVEPGHKVRLPIVRAGDSDCLLITM